MGNDLGFVDTTAVLGQAIPENDPTAVAGVNLGDENTNTVVHVTDENTGAPLSGIDHVSDPRQVANTTAGGSASFTASSGGPVTVTIGMSGYEFFTAVDFNLLFLDMALKPMGSSFSAFIQGTAANYTHPFGIVIGGGDLDEKCPTKLPICENLNDETPGFYRFETDLPNGTFNLSAIDFASNINPSTTTTNFTAVTGVAGPLMDGQTLTVDLTFPNPAATPTDTTIGAVTVPESLGTIDMVVVGGNRNLVVGPGELTVGVSVMFASLYDYILPTFDFEGVGTSTTIPIADRFP